MIHEEREQSSATNQIKKPAIPERGKFGTVSKTVETINLKLERSLSILCNLKDWFMIS